MGVKISALSAVSALTGAEIVPAVQSGTTKRMTTAEVAAYAVDTLAAASAVDPMTSGDDFLIFRSGVEKLADVSVVTAYIAASAFDSTSAGTLVTGDKLLAERSDVLKSTTVDAIKTFVLDGVQTTALDIHALSAATLADSDQYLVVQGSTPLKTTWADMAARAHGQILAYLEARSELTVLADADLFLVDQGSTLKKMSASTLATYISAEVAAGVLDTAWDATEVPTLASGDMLVLQRSDVQKTADVDAIVTFVDAEFADSTPVDPAASGDLLVAYRSGDRKVVDVDDVAAYAVALPWTAAAVASVTGTDVVMVQRSDVAKTSTVDAVKTYVLTGIQADVLDLSGLTAATLGGTDTMLVCQSTTPLKTTLDTVKDYVCAAFAAYTAGLSDAAAVVDADKFYMLNSGTAKYCTGVEIATYVIAEAWTASSLASVLTGDELLVYRTGTGARKATVDMLATFAHTSSQATILNISGLASATIAGTDKMLFCQSGTAKQATATALNTFVHGAFAAYTAALTEATTLADTDNMYLVQSTTPVRVTLGDVAAYCAAQANELPWTTISATKYTATPASTSEITMSDTSDVAVGMPVKYTYNGVTYYGIITASSGNIVVAGAPLDVGHDITELCVGLPQQVVQMDFYVPGDYDGGVASILASVAKQYCQWRRGAASLVTFSAVHKTADTGEAQPKINPWVEGAPVSTNDSNKGVQLSTSGTWVDNSAVAINTTNYAVDFGDDLEIRLTEVGTNGGSSDLTVSLTFVLH